VEVCSTWRRRPLVVAVAPHTGKTIKNVLDVFERGENLSWNGILYFVIRLFEVIDTLKMKQTDKALKAGLD